MSRIEILFEKFYNKTATAEERQELARLIGSSDDQHIGDLIVKAGERSTQMEGIFSEESLDTMLRHILTKNGRILEPLPEKTSVYRRLWFRVAAAAAIILVVGTITIRLLNKELPTPPPATVAANDATPGSTGATLVLGNGQVVQLDSTTQGTVALQSGTKVQLKDGQLLYDPATAAGISMNTLSTPRGRQFTVQLPDGSKVWLNAASSITYPSAFTGKERKVNIQGEAYFEIAKNARQPFIVSVNGKMDVKVLGTHFNINSYDDEPALLTTLLSGSVEVSNAERRMMLHPGQQSILKKSNAAWELNEDPNTEEITAWKDGTFYFDNSSLPVILRQFERWYDVQVIYDGVIKEKKYFAIISRKSPLSKVLQLLQAADVRFKIEGKKLYVQSY